MVEDGVDSAEGMWPWQLAVETEIFGVFTYRCGASLITPEWAITSASCVNTSGPFRLVAGEHSLAESSGNENYRIFTPTDVTMVGVAHIRLRENISVYIAIYFIIRFFFVIRYFQPNPANIDSHSCDPLHVNVGVELTAMHES